jgi:hypothetical protein
VQALADAGAGFIVLHQAVDCPADLAPSFKEWFGAAFQSDIGCRGHWDVKFDSVSSHDVTSGMKPFELLKDGWLYNLHFAEKGVTPLLAAQMPDQVAELTKLHDVWLADMAKPVKAGEKRYDMAVKEGTTPKKSKKMTKEEKQKARDMERAKKRQTPSPNATPEAPKS